MRSAPGPAAEPLLYSPPLGRTAAPRPPSEAFPRPSRRLPHAVSELDDVWAQIGVALRERVGERTFGLWLEPLRVTGLDANSLSLEGPREVSAWAASRLGSAITSASALVLGSQVAVTIMAGRWPATGSRAPPRSRPPRPSA